MRGGGGIGGQVFPVRACSQSNFSEQLPNQPWGKPQRPCQCWKKSQKTYQGLQDAEDYQHDNEVCDIVICGWQYEPVVYGFLIGIDRAACRALPTIASVITTNTFKRV